MSSIRLFVLGSLQSRGAMHGHGLRLLAEEEHINLWTDFTVGAVYGAMKRLAAEGLITEVRTEREGNYPERQVYDITAAGREALRRLAADGLAEVVMRPDPFDLVLARLDPDTLDELQTAIAQRLDGYRALLRETEERAVRADPFLTVAERHSMLHRQFRVRAEISWHEQLLDAVPMIVTDERSRKDLP